MFLSRIIFKLLKWRFQRCIAFGENSKIERRVLCGLRVFPCGYQRFLRFTTAVHDLRDLERQLRLPEKYPVPEHQNSASQWALDIERKELMPCVDAYCMIVASTFEMQQF